MAQVCKVEVSKPRPTQCCCGCSIKDGCLLIGWWGVIGGLLASIWLILALSLGYDYSDFYASDNQNSYGHYNIEGDSAMARFNKEKIINEGFNDNSLAGYNEEDDDALKTFLPIIFAIYLIFYIISVIVHALLLHGVYKAQPKLVEIWIDASKVAIVLAGLSLNIIGFGFIWYFKTIITAHRDNLLEGKDRGPHEVENPGYGYEIRGYTIRSYPNQV